MRKDSSVRVLLSPGSGVGAASIQMTELKNGVFSRGTQSKVSAGYCKCDEMLRPSIIARFSSDLLQVLETSAVLIRLEPVSYTHLTLPTILLV